MSDRRFMHRMLLLGGLLGLCWLFTFGLSAETTAPSTQYYYVEITDTHARSMADGARLIESTFGGSIVQQVEGIRSFYVVALSAENARQIQSQRPAAVGIIEPIPSYNLASETYPYSHTLMQSRAAWDANQDDELDPNANAGGDTRVCIIDTGIATDHKEFIGTSITGTSQIANEDWQYDPSGHGTHIGGVIAARLQGVGLAGIAPEANLHLVKMFDYGENWVDGQSNLAAALLSCHAAGAKIVNLSIASCNPPSQLEQLLLEDLYRNEDMLFVSAAGNGQNECTLNDRAYPASFDSVISVGAIDKYLSAAPFSQQNDAVELVAPGVDVLSLWPSPNNGGIPQYHVTDAQGIIYQSEPVEPAVHGTVQGLIVDGGLCDTTAAEPSWQNNIVLCERGGNSFAAKVATAEANGAIGTILYNNVSGPLMAGLGAASPQAPVLALSQADGTALRAQAGTIVTLTSDLGIVMGSGGYETMSGTSQASAHVAAAAAVVWSACPHLSNDQVRSHLSGVAVSPSNGRSDLYGFGIVRISAALDALFDGVNTYNGVIQLGSDRSNAECISPSAVQLTHATLQPSSFNSWLLGSVLMLSLSTAYLLITERKRGLQF